MDNYLKNKEKKRDGNNIVFNIKVPHINKRINKIYYENCKIIKHERSLLDKIFGGGYDSLIFEDGSGKRHNMPKLDKDGIRYGLDFASGLKCALFFLDDGNVEFNYNTKDQQVIVEKDGRPIFYTYMDGDIKRMVNYYYTNNAMVINHETKTKIIKEIFKNDKLYINSYFNKNENTELVHTYRKDGTKKYVIYKKCGKEVFSYFYLPSSQKKPVIIEKKNESFTIINPKTREKATIIISKDYKNILKTIPNKEKYKQIVNNIFNNFLKDVNFLDDNLGQILANMYMYVNFDNKKIFLNFCSQKTQLKTLKGFQKKYFLDGDDAEFKVGIIANKNNNHSLCLVIPNPKKYPREKAILFDSNFSAKYKMNNNIYTDVNEELIKDTEIINSMSMQHGYSCTLFALSAVDTLIQNKTFLDIKAKFVDVQESRKFKIPTKFEEEVAKTIITKYKVKKPMIDKYGNGIFTYDFEKELKKMADIYKSKEQVVNSAQKQLEKVEKCTSSGNDYHQKQVGKRRTQVSSNYR